MVGPCWKYRFYDVLRTFYQNNGSPVKNRFFPNKPSFCVYVCTCLAKPVRSYIDLLSLQDTATDDEMKWKSKIKTNK